MDGRTSFVKIDVEGHEPEVFEGMSRVIADSRPKILFECNPGGPAVRCESILRDNGYSLFSLVDRNVRELSRLIPEDIPAGQHNFLAVHSGR